jgi:integrase
MATTSRKRRPKGSGKCRQLPSGRWQAKIIGPDGAYHPAPQTFDTKMDADAWLAGQIIDLEIGTWAPPAKAAKVGTLEEYADEWLETRDLRPRVRVEYRSLLDGRIIPDLGSVPVTRLTSATVRRWYAKQGDAAPSARAHAYALLRTIMATAVEDEIIDANPCKLKGASTVARKHKVRPATLEEIDVMVERLPDRYKAMLLLATWCGPRYGEITELRRGDVDLDDGVIRIRRAVVLVEGSFVVGATKSEAGVRDVDIPPHLIPTLEAHMAEHVGPKPDALLFPSARDPRKHLAVGTLNKVFYPARHAAGRDDLRWHDLRHTGATLAAATGATLADLQARIGHSTVAAAMLYQHAAQGKGKQIAARLSEIALGSDDGG